MAKIWCEECEGTGERHESYMTADKGICFADGACQVCQGKGYTESPETQRLIEIGRATVEAFEEIYTELCICNIRPSGEFEGTETIGNVEELLEWHRAQEVDGDALQLGQNDRHTEDSGHR